MSRRLLKVGIVGYPPFEKITQLQYISQLQYMVDVRFDPTLELVIVYGNGVSPLLRCFVHNGKNIIPTKPVDPAAMYFYEVILQQYYDVEIPVVFLGDTAIYAYDFLRGKVGITTKSWYLIHNENDAIVVENRQDEILGFRDAERLIFGFLNEDSRIASETIRLLLQQISKDLDNNNLITSGTPDDEPPLLDSGSAE